MIDLKSFEVFKQYVYQPFTNNGKRFLLSSEPYLDIVLTDFCNSRCGFCIGNLSGNKAVGVLSEFKKKIKYAVDYMNVKEVLLLGGEPTISVMLLDIIKYCKSLNLNKICMTTNGYRLKDEVFRNSIMKSGLTHLNISLMNLDEKKQREWNNNSNSLSLSDISDICIAAQENHVSVRINANSFKGNLDSVSEIVEFYEILDGWVDSIKISPLLKTDDFSVYQGVNDWVNTHILHDNEYDTLFTAVIKHFELVEYVNPIDNPDTFGFVRNTIIPLYPTVVILNWNQHGKMMKKVTEEHKINNIKLLTNGELSLSWNKRNSEYFIKTE
jgi:molybdenum cofactor biosynthesis enzyme MoaA